MNKQHEKYSNAACPNCKQVGTKHGVYLCESYGDYQSDKGIKGELYIYDKDIFEETYDFI